MISRTYVAIQPEIRDALLLLCANQGTYICFFLTSVCKQWKNHAENERNKFKIHKCLLHNPIYLSLSLSLVACIFILLMFEMENTPVWNSHDFSCSFSARLLCYMCSYPSESARLNMKKFLRWWFLFFVFCCEMNTWAHRIKHIWVLATEKLLLNLITFFLRQS